MDRAGIESAGVIPTSCPRFHPIRLKLLLHPLLVLGIGSAAIWFGAPLPQFTLWVLVLAAALPSASSVSLLAERYGADNGRVTRAIVASTVLAFASFTLIAWVAMAALG